MLNITSGTWIDKCRMQEYDENGVPLSNGSGKFHSAKRFRKPTMESSSVAKTRSFSLGRAFSKSIDNLYKHEVKIDMTSVNIGDDEDFHVAKESKTSTRMAASRSTNDLLDDKDDFIIKKASLDRRSVKSMDASSKNTLQISKEKMTKLFSLTGKLKTPGWIKKKESEEQKKKKKETKRRNSNDIDLLVERDKDHENRNKNENNNNRLKIRPSVLEFVRNFKEGNNDNSDNKHNRNNERKSHIARSTSIAARPLPSPDYQQSQTLFKTRRHNDSVKRVKTKTWNIRPSSAGPLSGNLFYDPERSGADSAVRKDICDL